MNIRKAAVPLALLFALALPLAAHAAVFANLSGAVASMNVQITTISFGGGLLKTTKVHNRGKDTGSVQANNPSFFWELSDTVVFSDAQVDIAGRLISPGAGTNASGPVGFVYTSPAVQPRDGSQVTVSGAANAKVTLNNGTGKASVKLTNFIPSFAQVENFKNNTSVNVSIANAKISLPAMNKLFAP